MQFVRFQQDAEIASGILEGNTVRKISGDIFGSYDLLNTCCSLADIRLLAPCCPSKIVAAGLNYRSHAGELHMAVPDEPLIFLKPPSAVTGHEQSIMYPAMSRRVDYEGELAVVIGRICGGASREEALEYILGYTCINDVTARDLQQKDGQFTRSKSFDTFAPLGPWIETDLDPADVRIETFLNGEKKQDGRTADFIFPVPHLVSFISQVMTLYPGDVIATGTPAGIGPMHAGDVVEVHIGGIGVLRNKVSCRMSESG